MTMRLSLLAVLSCLLLNPASGFVPIGKTAALRVQPSTTVGAVLSIPQVHQRKSSLVLHQSAVLSSGSSRKPSAFIAVVQFFFINEVFRAVSANYGIAFPASLSGCGALFATFLFLPFGPTLYDQFAPGAAVLAKWLPVFFVPSLIALPLADSVGSAAELLKIAGVVVGGFFFTLFSTAFSVLAARKLTNKVVTPSLGQIESGLDVSAIVAPAPKAFSTSLTLTLRVVAAVSALLTIVAKRTNTELATAVRTSFLLSTTLHNFVFGARLPKKFTKIVHPLVTCTSLTWLAMKIVGKITGASFHSLLTTYAASQGAGRILLNFLGPAVISLACQMYDRRKLMKENVSELMAAIGVSSLGGLFGTAAAVRLLRIGSPSIRLSLLSRNITSPLAMAIAGILGADVSLAVTMVVVTGLIGANFGASILDAAGVKDAVARGLGIGAAAHGLGTAAFANEKDAFPFAAIAMALTASSCTVLVSIPFIKSAVMKLALGW